MALNEFFDAIKIEKKTNLHYYGDMVRSLFMLAAVVMIVTLPFVNEQLPVSLPVSILAILFLGISAAITNPLQLWSIITNATISIVAFSIFEYYSVSAYFQYSIFSLLFWTNQVLAIIFIFSTYYSIKTLRGHILKKRADTAEIN